MFTFSNLNKILRIAAGAPAAMKGFPEMDKFVAVALRAGAGLPHGTHLVADAA